MSDGAYNHAAPIFCPESIRYGGRSQELMQQRFQNNVTAKGEDYHRLKTMIKRIVEFESGIIILVI